MNALPKTKPDDTRDRIMDVADRLFRQLGFAKTTVADIAAELDMSPANVYGSSPPRMQSSKRSAGAAWPSSTSAHGKSPGRAVRRWRASSA